MTTDSSPLPEGEPPVPDDVWDRFLQDSERNIRATAPKEPSARARMVARRLREEDARAAAEAPRRRFGRRGRGPVRAAPPAWRSGSTDESERRLSRRRRLRSTIGLVLVVLVVLIALSPGRAWSLVSGGGWRHSGAAVPVPAATLSGPGASSTAVSHRMPDGASIIS